MNIPFNNTYCFIVMHQVQFHHKADVIKKDIEQHNIHFKSIRILFKLIFSQIVTKIF